MSQPELPAAELPPADLLILQSPGPVPQFLLGSPSTPQRLVSSAPGSADPEHPSPPSSSGSNKRYADTDISELVRKAKASRYNNQPPKQNDDDIADTLERDLSCAICSEVLANPVACLDCLHNFCGSCLVPWLERSDTCPTCRQTVKGTQDNHSTANLIESLLNRFPDKKRDPEELKELERIYKPGQKITITNTYSDEDDEPDPEEEEEDEGITWPPCPCCTTPNPHGFTCLDPIPPPDPIRGPQRADVFSYRSHLRCQSCPNTFPTAWKTGWKCENCNYLSCGNLFDCALPGFLQPVSTQATNITPHNPSLITITMHSGLVNYTNQIEQALFEAWMTTSNLGWSDIAQKIYDWLLVKHAGVIPFLGKVLRPEDFACQPCMMATLKGNFVNWWIHERESSGYVDNRAKCWYGRGCRTQIHNQDHARRLCHSCEEIPAARRRNDAPPRDGGVALGGPAGDMGGWVNGNGGGEDGGGIGGVGGDGANDNGGGH